MRTIFKNIYYSLPADLLRRLFWAITARYLRTNLPERLHLGCGTQRLDGYLNVDARKTRATDMVADIRNLPFPPASFSRIEHYHVIEHLGRHDLAPALRDWHRLLKPGGTMAMECPDLDRAMQLYLAGNTAMLDTVFGKQRYAGDTHYFGYNFPRLQALLEACGFTDIAPEPPTDYHAASEPCLRVVCRKAP